MLTILVLAVASILLGAAVVYAWSRSASRYLERVADPQVRVLVLTPYDHTCAPPHCRCWRDEAQKEERY